MAPQKKQIVESTQVMDIVDLLVHARENPLSPAAKTFKAAEFNQNRDAFSLQKDRKLSGAYIYMIPFTNPFDLDLTLERAQVFSTRDMPDDKAILERVNAFIEKSNFDGSQGYVNGKRVASTPQFHFGVVTEDGKEVNHNKKTISEVEIKKSYLGPLEPGGFQIKHYYTAGSAVKMNGKESVSDFAKKVSELGKEFGPQNKPKLQKPQP